MCTDCWTQEDPYDYPMPGPRESESVAVSNEPLIQQSAGLLARTLQGKNNDYRVDGEFSNFERAADFASTAPIKVMMTQIAIKYTRIQGGLRSDESFNYESLKDSLLDLAGYAVIAHAYLSKDS